MSSNKITDVFSHYQKKLALVYEEQEGRSMLYQLIHHFFKFDKIGFVKNPDFRLTESELLKLHFAVKELLTEKPLQYIIGEVEFLGLKIKVNPHVLIPRPETEELVQLIRTREDFKNPVARLLDIGCGSGCIPITLKKHFPDVEILGLDVSGEALKLATENAKLNETDVEFVNQDILDEKKWSQLGKIQMIVSNPPYVRDSEKELMQKNVLDFEPDLALFVSDADPLLFYRKIAEFAQQSLGKRGVLYFEINEAFGTETKDLLESKGFKSVEVLKDMHGKDRFIRALK